MDRADRSLINSLKPRLVAEISDENFDKLIQDLTNKKILFEEDITNIKNEGDYPKQKGEFFDLIQRRGPKAFKELLLALHGVGEAGLCFLFKQKIFRDPSSDGGLTLIDDSGERYDLSSTPTGLMLLVNVDEYKGTKTPWFSSDVEKLKRLWESFGFTVDTLHNPNMPEFRAKLEELQSRFDKPTTSLSSVVVYVMCSCPASTSISDEIYLVTREDQLVTAQHVMDYFKASKAPGLIGKPKLFFFERFKKQSSQMSSRKLDSGDSFMQSVRINGHSVAPNTADIFYVSVLHTAEAPNGSDFVSAMCQIFPEYKSSLDVVSLINKVSNEVMYTCDIVQGKRGFDKKLYLN